MISNTTERLFIVKSNTFFKNIYFFSLCKEFYIYIYGPFSCLVNNFWVIFLLENLSFFKCSLNFRVHALQSVLNQVGYANFVKIGLQSMSSKIELAYEKITIFFYLYFPNSKYNANFYGH